MRDRRRSRRLAWYASTTTNTRTWPALSDGLSRFTPTPTASRSDRMVASLPSIHGRPAAARQPNDPWHYVPVSADDRRYDRHGDRRRASERRNDKNRPGTDAEERSGMASGVQGTARFTGLVAGIAALAFVLCGRVAATVADLPPTLDAARRDVRPGDHCRSLFGTRPVRPRSSRALQTFCPQLLRQRLPVAVPRQRNLHGYLHHPDMATGERGRAPVAAPVRKAPQQKVA